MKKFLFSGLFSLLFLGTAYANDHYVIVIESNTTESRLHLFQSNREVPSRYPRDDNPVPVIKEILSAQVAPALSAYAKHPEDAGKSLEPLFNAALVELNARHIPAKDVNILVVGTTESRRAISNVEVAEIYLNVTDFIKKTKYGFNIMGVGVVQGDKDALYGWLDVNYLAKNFQNYTPTIGVIKMGRLSTQLCSDMLTAGSDYIRLNGRTYAVTTRNYTDLGQDLALDEMDRFYDQFDGGYTQYCYPKGLKHKGVEGQFNSKTCSRTFETFLYYRPEKWLNLSSQNFYIYGDAFNTYEFFKANPDNLVQRVEAVCSKTWEQLVKEYPKVPLADLAKYCAAGTYISELFYSPYTYSLSPKKTQVIDKINNQEINWARGALLYAFAQ